MDAIDEEVLFVGTAEAEHTEMYLKAVWHIREKGDDVKISTIAKRLNVRQPSVVQMLKKLAERDLVTYNKAGVTLKDSGEKVMIERKDIHPNVDYPTGPTYHLMGFDTDFFTPIFVISRITGWSAHIIEQHAANKLIRPLASYKGNQHRKVVQLNQR